MGAAGAYSGFMPYRGDLEPRIACSAHSAAESVGGCSRCRVPLCDPCTLYFAAEPYCRRCIGRARRAWAARIAGGVFAVVLLLAFGSGVMLAAVPTRVEALAIAPPPIARAQQELCAPDDTWLDMAERDLAFAHYHIALHHLSMS